MLLGLMMNVVKGKKNNIFFLVKKYLYNLSILKN